MTEWQPPGDTAGSTPKRAREDTWRHRVALLRWGGAIGGLTLLVFMIRQAGVSRVVAQLVALGPWVLIILPVSASWFLLNTYAWSIALRPRRVSWRALLRAHVIGEAVSNLTPFMALGGEPLKIALLRGLVPDEVAAASVVGDNVVHAASAPVFMMLGLALGVWAFGFGAALAGRLLVPVAVAGLAAWGLLRLSGRGLVAPTVRLALRALSRNAHATLVDRAGNVDRTVGEFLRAGQWPVWAALGAHLAGRMMGAVEACVIMAALGTPLSLAAATFVIAVTHVAVNLVFSVVPSQLGVQEGAAYLLFSAVSLDPASAIALMLVRRVRGFFWNGVGLALLADDRARDRAAKKTTGA